MKSHHGVTAASTTLSLTAEQWGTTHKVEALAGSYYLKTSDGLWKSIVHPDRKLKLASPFQNQNYY